MTSPEEWSEMDRRTADRLLRGDRTGHPLDPVLAAATAPATAQELAGESDAMAAFRAAAHSPAPRRQSSLLRAAVARLLTLKVAVVALGTSATIGGVALAANTGALPGPHTDHTSPASVPSSETATVAPKQAASTLPRPAPAATANPDRVTELCQEFTLHDRDTRTRALNDGRFGELVRRAGEKDRERVEQFCGSRPRNSPSSTFRGTYSSPRPEYSAPTRDDTDQRPEDGGQWSPRPRTSAGPSNSPGPRR
jgi:hypothetical protein